MLHNGHNITVTTLRTSVSLRAYPHFPRYIPPLDAGPFAHMYCVRTTSKNFIETVATDTVEAPRVRCASTMRPTHAASGAWRVTRPA